MLEEGSVLICMGVIIIAGLLGLHAAQGMLEAFDGHCIYTWNVSFSSRNNTLQQPSISIIRTTTALPVTRSTVKSSAISSNLSPYSNFSRARKIDHIFQNLQPAGEATVTGNEENENILEYGIHGEELRNENDYAFLSTMQVDIGKSMWAPLAFCDYVLYNQAISSIAGMLCTTMLILYNSGGKVQVDWGIPKPWRIVFPAVIAFGIMSIVAGIHLLIMNHAYNDFCDGLSSNLELKTISCKKLINTFYPLIRTSTFLPGTHYIMHITTIRLTFIAWLLAFIIMIARMLFVIDFRLVSVTISTFSGKEMSNVPERSSSESNEEIEQEAQNLDNKGLKIIESSRTDAVSSIEEIDDFQSAHSDVEGATHSTFIDPLLLAEQ